MHWIRMLTSRQSGRRLLGKLWECQACLYSPLGSGCSWDSLIPSALASGPCLFLDFCCSSVWILSSHWTKAWQGWQHEETWFAYPRDWTYSHCLCCIFPVSKTCMAVSSCSCHSYPLTTICHGRMRVVIDFCLSLVEAFHVWMGRHHSCRSLYSIWHSIPLECTRSSHPQPELALDDEAPRVLATRSRLDSSRSLSK